MFVYKFIGPGSKNVNLGFFFCSRNSLWVKYVGTAKRWIFLWELLRGSLEFSLRVSNDFLKSLLKNILLVSNFFLQVTIDVLETYTVYNIWALKAIYGLARTSNTGRGPWCQNRISKTFYGFQKLFQFTEGVSRIKKFFWSVILSCQNGKYTIEV